MNDEVEQPGGQGTGSGNAMDANAKAFLDQCQTQASEFLNQLFDGVIAALDDAIKQLDDSSPFVEEELRLLDELRMVRANREQMGSTLQDRFNRFYREALRPQRDERRPYLSVDTPAEDNFSLVNDHQLEEWLAIDRMIGKIVEFHSEETEVLRQRFRHLIPGLNDGSIDFPLGPDKFCHAFHEALECLEIGIRTRISCYELLDRELTSRIGGFYHQINEMLKERGVLPDLKVAPVSRSTHRSRRSEAARDSFDESSWSDEVERVHGGGFHGYRQEGPRQDRSRHDAGRGGAGSTPIQEQMFVAMQHLLNVHFSQASSAFNSVIDGQQGDAVTLPVTPMLVETLSSLQHDEVVIERAGELIRGGLKSHVIGRFSVSGGAPGGADINRIDDETIEVISMIFDYILDDRSLPDFMKALIGRLQIPVLKVAIIDRGFFKRKSHPARQLLNELSHAGLGWRDENEAAMDRLYQKMEAIVRRILEEFENDIGIFEELLAEFRTFLEEEAEKFNETQARLLEVAQENERRERITVQLAQEIAKRLMQRQVPEDIREFLLTAWREYLTSLMLGEAEEREKTASAEALDFIEDLVWSLQPKYGPEERQKLVSLLPSLLDTLRTGTAHIGHPEEQTERLIQSLEGHHFNCMKAGRKGGDRPTQAPAPAEDTQAVVEKSRQDEPEPVEPSDPVEPVAAASEPLQELPEGSSAEDSRRGASDVDRLFAEINDDLDELSSINWDDLTSFDDVIEMKSSEEQQQSFEQMMAEMGLEMERDEGPRVEDEYTELVRSLELGVWVELTSEVGQTQRARLAWKGDDYSAYSFVNRQYKVVAERPLYVLAAEFRVGKAALIEEAALFERAMNGVIGGLTKLASGAEH